MELVRILKISDKNDGLNKNIIESVTHNEALTMMMGWTLDENDWNQRNSLRSTMDPQKYS